jgi:hypothetical protein
MKVRHATPAQKDDLKFFKRLLPLFVRRMESHVHSNMENYKGWRSIDSLKESRKRLLELVKKAVLEKQDGLMKGAKEDKPPNLKDNPYIEIAVLAAACYYHLDTQMREVIDSLLGE